MTPEDWLWHEVAWELKKTIGQVKRGMTHRERLRWVLFLRNKFNEPSRTDHQIAQNTWLLWCILSILTGNKIKKEVKDFLIKFDFVSRKVSQTPVDELSAEEINTRIDGQKKEHPDVTAMNKAILLGTLGLSLPKDFNPNKPFVLDTTKLGKGTRQPKEKDEENGQELEGLPYPESRPVRNKRK